MPALVRFGVAYLRWNNEALRKKIIQSQLELTTSSARKNVVKLIMLRAVNHDTITYLCLKTYIAQAVLYIV